MEAIEKYILIIVLIYFIFILSSVSIIYFHILHVQTLIQQNILWAKKDFVKIIKNAGGGWQNE